MKGNSDISKKFKIKMKLDFPQSISNEELRHLKKKINKNIANIQDTNDYLQKNSLFQENKGNIIYKYYQELNRLKNIESNQNNNIKKNSNIFNKKNINEKNKNRRIFTSINRRTLENVNKNTPPNIFDFIHPHEYYFTQRRNKTINNSQISNNNSNYTKYSTLKNQSAKNNNNKISKIFTDNNINSNNNSERINNNKFYKKIIK